MLNHVTVYVTILIATGYNLRNSRGGRRGGSLREIAIYKHLFSLGKVVRPNSFLLEVDSHALKNCFHGDVDLGNDDIRQGRAQLLVSQRVVASACFEDQSLFLYREVCVGVGWVDVLLVEVEHLVMGNGAGVAEIVNSCQFALSHHERYGQHVSQGGHGVRNIDDAVIFDNLGHEVAVRQIVADWHSHAEGACGRVVLEKVLNNCL